MKKFYPVLPVGLAWAAFYLPRLFQLGFDADDWLYLIYFHGVATLGERFSSLMQIMGARPVMVAVLSIYPSIINGSPMVAQAVSAMACLVMAILIYRVLAKLSVAASEDAARFIAALGAIVWLTIPWSLGYTAWPIMITGLLSAIAFLWSFDIALRPKQTTVTLLAASALQLISYLNYEIFYGQFLLIFVAKFLRERPAQPDSRFILKPFCWFTTTQMVALAINRLIVHIAPAAGKPIHLDIHSYLAELVSLPTLISKHVAGRAFWLMDAIVLGYIAATVVKGKFRNSTMILVATILIGVAANAALLHLGSYAFSFERRTSRVFLCFNVLLVFLAFIIIDRAVASVYNKPRSQMIAAFVPLAVLIGLFIPALYVEQTKWATAWVSVLATVDHAPDFRNIPAGTDVIYNGPTNTKGFTFLGDVELTYAMYWRHRESGPVKIYFFTTGEGINYQWDGDVLTFSMPGYWTLTTKVSALRLWDYSSSTVSVINPPATIYPVGR